MKILRLKPKEERRLLRGHLWAYRNEFAEWRDIPDATLVDVVSAEGRFVGRGFAQSEGGIAVRILAHHQETIDRGFFSRRIADARVFRERLFPDEQVYRWVFGESDGLPGLVADRYGSVVAVETPCSFYGAFADDLAAAFLEHPGIEGVRFELHGEVRRFGRVPDAIEVQLGGLRLGVDLEQGQKTGMFLDQRVNVRQMAGLARGGRVLDGHCYVGLWSCHAAAAGASSVLGVDSSAKAVERARHNAALNGFDSRCSFECASVSEVLARGDRYDLVIIDPPALAKSRGQAPNALKLYQSLNRDAMKAVGPGGCLITSCCSHFVERAAFLEALKRSARAAQRSPWILEVRGAAPDHPVLLAMPETEYLTCVTLRLP